MSQLKHSHTENPLLAVFQANEPSASTSVPSSGYFTTHRCTKIKSKKKEYVEEQEKGGRKERRKGKKKKRRGRRRGGKREVLLSQALQV